MRLGELYAFSRDTRTIRVGQIGRRVRKILDPNGTIGVNTTDPLTKFFAGGNPANILPNMINSDPAFRADFNAVNGMGISVGELRDAETVLDVITVIVDEYQDHSWNVRAG
ncbi:hypothetical protein [Mesorhizobium sp. M0088]|uniref:hypothetical protein n=1 Tax=Mesorhizobium sp. M0088 TaxID=2956873 RepID=UPI0033383EA0